MPQLLSHHKPQSSKVGRTPGDRVRILQAEFFFAKFAENAVATTNFFLFKKFIQRANFY
jgi:hypothetical protein